MSRRSPAPSESDWAFELSPYIWAAFVDADLGLPWDGPNLAPSEQRLDTKITGAFMIAGKAKYRSFGVFGDFNWLRLDTETVRTGRLYSGADLTTDFTANLDANGVQVGLPSSSEIGKSSESSTTKVPSRSCLRFPWKVNRSHFTTIAARRS